MNGEVDPVYILAGVIAVFAIIIASITMIEANITTRACDEGGYKSGTYEANAIVNCRDDEGKGHLIQMSCWMFTCHLIE